MKSASVLLVVCCCLSVCSSQWLEKTIQLTPGTEPTILGYNPQDNKINCVSLNSDYLLVISGVTNEITASVLVPGAGSFCYNSHDNKIYCAHADSLAVIDGTSDLIVAGLAVGRNPNDVVYNSQSDKVYTANLSDNSVTIVDAHADTVISTVRTDSAPWALCYNPLNNKVYCANRFGSSVTVIDGSTDTVITALMVGGIPWSLCYNTQSNKVYCGNQEALDVTVADGATNEIIADVAAGAHHSALCYNPQSNVVYCANSSSRSLTVIDGEADTVVATVATDSSPVALCYNLLNNTVYCACWYVTKTGVVQVIDCASNTVRKTIGVGSGPISLAWNPEQNRVYVANRGSSSISVLRDTMPSGVQELGAGVRSMGAATVLRGILYVPLASGIERGTVSVLLDVSGRKVLDLQPGANDVRALAPGVYFVREAQSQAQAVRKVILTK